MYEESKITCEEAVHALMLVAILTTAKAENIYGAIILKEADNMEDEVSVKNDSNLVRCGG